MSNFITPPVSVVTSQEAAQSGASTGHSRKITSSQKTRIDRFIKAHLNNNASAAEQAATAALRKPQVSAEEQASAVALMGGARQPVRRSNSKNIDVYQALFTKDEDYLEMDLKYFQNSFSNKQPSLVDSMTNWAEPQKALRKFLLTAITLENKGADPTLIKDVQKTQSKLLVEHGEYIRGSIAAVEVGQKLNLTRLTLKDFVRVYNILDASPSDGKTAELMHLFKMIRKSIEAGHGTAEMVNMCNNLYAVLKRERSQNPSKATSTRQYLILSRIKQLQTLTVIQSLHTTFLKTCQKANLYGLPKLAELMHTCLQITAAGDTIIGVNSLMKIAGAVGTQKPGAQNMFIPYYSNAVLQSEPMGNLYKTDFHRKQVGDHIIKSMQSSGLLNTGSSVHSKTS